MITFPEPECDLLAQMEALKEGKKDVVFIAHTNRVPPFVFDDEIRHHARQEGTFFYANLEKAPLIHAPQPLTTRDLARILDYPVAKDDLKDPMIVQVRDANDHVIMECASDHPEAAAKEFEKMGGEIVFMTMEAAIARREALINGAV